MSTEETREETPNGTAQEDQLPDIKPKMKLEGKVIKITLAGAIVDIGTDQPGMLHISRLQKSPVNRVEDVLEEGQTVEAWVRRVDEQSGRVELTMIEPLALEWRELKKDMVLRGAVTRIENFGAFVDIGAERPGLVHISELTHGYIRTPNEVVRVGDEVEVKIIGVNRRKKRIRLSMKALEEVPVKEQKAGKESDQPPLDDKPVPTAMEMALREAMERNKEGEETSSDQKKSKSSKHKSKSSKNDEELDDILNRTLEQEVGAS